MEGNPKVRHRINFKLLSLQNWNGSLMTVFHFVDPDGCKMSHLLRFDSIKKMMKDNLLYQQWVLCNPLHRFYQRTAEWHASGARILTQRLLERVEWRKISLQSNFKIPAMFKAALCYHNRRQLLS